MLQKIAIWHGGGNWGDLWPSVQKVRIQQSFRSLVQHNFSIFGMPQSLHYRYKESEAHDARLFKRELRKGAELANSNNEKVDNHASIVLSWREQESCDRARTLYPFVKHLLIPDIAFRLGPYMPESVPDNKKVDFLLLLRRDHESTVFTSVDEDEGDDDESSTFVTGDNATQRISVAVVSAMKMVAPNRSFRVVDWEDRWTLFHSTDPFFSETSIRLLSMGRVVISDRLHASILAFLSGMPFVYLDQSTGKISKSLNVAFDTWEGCRVGREGSEKFNNKTTTMESMWYAGSTNLTDAIGKGLQLLRLPNL